MTNWSRLPAFFKERFDIDDHGCWIWKGTRDRFGYGRFFVEKLRTTRSAHRATYELLKGPIPEGLEIDHLCRVRACVNPQHLEAVTHAENMRRGQTGKNQTGKKRGKYTRRRPLGAPDESGEAA